MHLSPAKLLCVGLSPGAIKAEYVGDVVESVVVAPEVSYYDR